MQVKARVADIHFDKANRGKDGYSNGRSETGVAKIVDENGNTFEVGVYSERRLFPGDYATVYGITPFLKDGFLTNEGLYSAGYEIDPYVNFQEE